MKRKMRGGKTRRTGAGCRRHSSTGPSSWPRRMPAPRPLLLLMLLLMMMMMMPPKLTSRPPPLRRRHRPRCPARRRPRCSHPPPALPPGPRFACKTACTPSAVGGTRSTAPTRAAPPSGMSSPVAAAGDAILQLEPAPPLQTAHTAHALLSGRSRAVPPERRAAVSATAQNPLAQKRRRTGNARGDGVIRRAARGRVRWCTVYTVNCIYFNLYLYIILYSAQPIQPGYTGR